MRHKILIRTLILSLILTVFPSFVGAQYYQPYGSYGYTDNSVQIAQIQQQINALYAQLAAMGYGSGTYNNQYQYQYHSYPYTGSVLGAYTGPTCNFTQDLSLGSSGQQVADLNRVLGSGTGSYFDQATYNAVTRFQQTYASEILTPAGYSYPTGFVGSFTRAKLNQICNGVQGSVLGASTYNPYYTGYNNNYNYNYTGSTYNTPTLNFYASNTYVNSGETVVLNWNSTNVSTCTASGGWSGDKPVNSSQSISNVQYSTTYNLNCYGYNGTQISRSVTVTLGSTGSGQYPDITFYASPATLAKGGQTLLTWNVTNASTCNASGDWSGSKVLSGSEYQYNLQSGKAYVLMCYGNNSQQASQSATVSVY